MFGSNPSTGDDSFMSSARPWGSPSMMSISTTSSARPFCTTRMAVVAPTNPLPTMVTFIVVISSWSVYRWRSGSRRGLVVAGLRAHRPLELVAPLDERARDRAGHALRVEVAIRGLDNRLLDEVPRVHPPGERHGHLQRSVAPHRRQLVEVRLHVRAQDLLLARPLEP